MKVLPFIGFILVSSTAASAQSHQTMDGFFYFTGTPPMTRLHRAAAQVRIDNNHAILYLGTAVDNDELTVDAAAKALGEPESITGTPLCTLEDIRRLGFSSDESKELRTYKFKLHTKKNHHYSLIFVGQENRLQFWRLILDKESDQQEGIETKWAPLLTTATFTGLNPYPNYELDAKASARELERLEMMIEKFHKGEVDQGIGVDSWPRFNKKKSPFPEKQSEKQ